MSYLKNSLCSGVRPHGLPKTPLLNRDTLLMKMMEDRHVLRVLCAPPSYGKTALAAQYAQVIFSFTHVAWITTHSPCFLREIDDGSLAESLNGLMRAPALVVFDDLPHLAGHRKQVFVGECEQLLKAGFEVVATMCPGNNPFDNLSDVCELNAEDLLLSDDEISHLSSVDSAFRRMGLPTHIMHRVPGMATRTTPACEEFMAAQMRQDISATQRALCYCMAVLGKGTKDVLEQLLNQNIDDAWKDLAANHPHWGMNDSLETFDADALPLSAVVRATAPYAVAIASVCAPGDYVHLVRSLANKLLCEENDERAVRLIVGSCEGIDRAAWLAQNQDTMIQRGMLVSSEVVYESLRQSSITPGARLKMAAAYRLCVVGRGAKGLPHLERMIRDRRLPLDVRLYAAFIFLEFASSPSEVETARVLVQTDTLSSAETQAQFTGDEVSLSLVKLAGLVNLWQCDKYRTLEQFCCAADGIPDIHERCQYLAWGLSVVRLQQADSDVRDCFEEYRARLADITCDALEEAQDAQNIGLAEWLLMHQARAVFDDSSSLSRVVEGEVNASLVSFDTVIQRQGVLLARFESAKLGAVSSTYKVAAAQAVKMRERHQEQARLCINVMGGLRVSLDDREIRLERRKAQAFLALLVIFQERTVSGARIAQLLWPSSDPEKAQKNLHSTWSLLRKRLSLDNGCCPFLIRESGTYRIAQSYVHTDWAQLDDLCRHLSLDAPDAMTFARILNEISSLRKGDLLPEHQMLEPVNTARSRMNVQLVDALTDATRALNEINESSVALRFVRYALEVDRRREDAYDMLIRTLIAAGQRPAAIEACFLYRDFMVEELGLDPARKTWELYESIINDDELLPEQGV